MPRPWTSRDSETLRRLREAGHGLLSCAAEMDRDAMTIRNRLAMMGLPLKLREPRRTTKHPADAARDRRFAAAWQQGVLGCHLEERFGVCGHGIADWVQRLGLPSRDTGRWAA